jgi:CBS domain-containing protein
MEEKNVGALLVIEDEKPVGIFSERDHARKVAIKGKTPEQTAIQEVMTSQLIGVSPKETLDVCMALMTGKFIRHLPVVEKETVIGVISIGDVVREIIAEQKFVIDQLVNYISGERRKPPVSKG